MKRQRDSGSTSVYINGGKFIGTFSGKDSIEYWKEIGREHNQRWMYKGYRWISPVPGFPKVTETEIVFDTEAWSASEASNRKAGGFLGIRKHKL